MKPSRINPMRLSVVAAMTGLLCAADANAANGTWTNAPADSSWTNVLNWIGSVPGTINNTGNNGVDGSSIATFTNPIPASLIGSASNPIIPDDGTIVNGKARMLSQLNFDGADCGAYVFSTLSAFQPRTATQPETGVISLCIPTTKLPNGSFIGASVATPQVFLIPVQIRLPSSTTAAYGFTNNATSPNATYYFDKMWLYPDATTRACTFLFAGSNTGTNTVAYLSESTNPSFSAACGVRKEGSGTWILSGANTLKAATPFDIAQGTLVVKDPASLGASGNVNVSNAVLQIDGITPNQMSINLRNGGNIRANGTLSLNGVAVGNQTGTSATLSTTSSGDVFTVGTGIAAGAFVTGGAVDSVLNTAGPGTLVFSQANT
ncbi:MAG TPA: hypothetical protein VK327_11105, partial [Candidatus Paceibacterota bacterium]|nr:hypothetical protein [Candidatus Paceibacterota bacterium]